MKNLSNIHQQGAALIVALFITALVAAAAITMIERLRIDTRRTALLLNTLQANLYAAGAIDWAKEKLINNWEQKQPNKIIDATPIRMPMQKINGAQINMIIYDAQGKLNINNLTDGSFEAGFTQLLSRIDPRLNLMAATKITQAITEWITPGKNSLDAYYVKQSPSYRAPHQFMTSVSELRLVKGITPALYNQLHKYVTALPAKTLININNAPLIIIMALNPALSPETAKSLDALRHQAPFTNLSALSRFAGLRSTQFTVTSDYFLVKTDILIGQQQVRLYTLLLRFIKDNHAHILTLWQSQGTL